MFASMSCGRIDHHMLKPAGRSDETLHPDEIFHQAISSLLLEWSEARRIFPYTINIVAGSWSGRAYELRDLLERCAMPHNFCLADSSDGRELIAAAGEGVKLPLVVMPDGTVLPNPSDTELAEATGTPVSPDQMDVDLVIVGAGPAGLSAGVYGASEGFSTLIVERGGIGGQATYSSLIRNYLGFPRGLSGRRLGQQAYDQAWLFGAKFAFMQTANDVRRDGDGLIVELSLSGEVRTRAVLLATGVSYRRLGVPELEELTGAGVYYGGTGSEAPGVSGQDVYVLGAGNSAAQSALHLAGYARRVTLVVRGEALGSGMSQYLIPQIEGTQNLRVRLGTEIVGGGGDGRLEQLVLRDRAAGSEEEVGADALFLMIGARPHTEWLPAGIDRDEHGFVFTGADIRDTQLWPLDRDVFQLETSMPGVLAAGDLRHGSVKRVASAVGEGSVAIQTLHRLFEADRLELRGRAKQPATAIES
jgi:thioredoxin reductase (NADPH)